MQSTITIPNNWDYPRFSFGQRTQQGLIIGIEYHPADTQLAYQYGQGWRYTVLTDKNSQEVRHYFDDQLQTLSVAEIQQQIQAEIDEHQQQIKALQQQLAAIGGSSDGNG
jgi:endonuclease/exonuclease/phosphatase (EEP) superfamily protein YafD